MSGEWKCPRCRCSTYARVDERKDDGSFGPGPEVRCVECKFVSILPANPITPEALVRMELVAKAATPGPWHVDPCNAPIVMQALGPIVARVNFPWRWKKCVEWEVRTPKANALHIATFDPPTVLSLIASARRAAELEAELSKRNEDYDAACGDREAMRAALEVAEGALKLGLEYWAHRQQRYKNRHPVWVGDAQAALTTIRQAMGMGS